MTTISIPSEYEVLAASFRRSLLAQNKAPKTVRAYIDAARLLLEYLRAQGMPEEPAHIRREHIEAFIADQLERHAPATANNRYRSLQQFFRWLAEEFVPEVATPVLRDEQIDGGFIRCIGDPAGSSP